MSQSRVTVTVGRSGQRTATLTSDGMNLDRVGGVGGNRKRPLKDRLGGSSSNITSNSLQFSGKRQRQESSWKQSLYRGDEDEDMLSANVQNSKQDLRHKLDQKNQLRSRQTLNSSATMVKDLREKISGPSQPPHGGQRVEVRRHPASFLKSMPMIGAFPVPNPAAPCINTVQKAPIAIEKPTVAALLQSLGLGKYLITFQAEEIDMTALRHMGDNDLKELGIPMGPRKKILLAISSKKWSFAMDGANW